MTDTALDALKAITTRNFYTLSPLERAIWMYADDGGTKAVEAAAELQSLRSQLAEAQAEREVLRKVADILPKVLKEAVLQDAFQDEDGYALIDDAWKVAGEVRAALEARTDAAQRTGDAAECPICHAVDYCVHQDN